jgi:amidase
VTQLHDLTVVQQREALRAGEVSSTELTAHYRARMDEYGEELGAFVERTDELARREARQADEQLRAGSTAPLLGIPTAFKDLQAVAGVPVHLGSAAVTVVPESDGPVVGRLRRAGVVTLGTTHAPELGPTCFTESAVVGRPAVTPYDTTRYASGSSGGAAAAVAAGLVPFAHGSDGAGSLRSPAAVCGLVGFKASRGRVPAAPSFMALGVEGVLTRTVGDTAALLDVVLGPGPEDLYGLPPVTGLEGQLAEGCPPLRVLRWGSARDDVGQAVDLAAKLLADLGHEVADEPAPLDWDDELREHLQVVVTASVAATARRLPHQELLAPYTRWCLEAAASRTAADFLAAQTALAAAASRHLALMAHVDVVLSPVTTQPAVPIGWFEQEGTGEACGRRMLAWSAWTPWANLTGQPAVSLPLHVTAAGLPVGVQLTGARVGDDARLLRLSAQLEEAAPFADRHPVQW